jgi:WD40 repeat protein
LASGYCARSENYACLEGGVLLWSTTTWDLFRDITGPGNWIEDLVFSQGDDLVIGADRYEYLHFWQVSDGVNLRSMRISSYGSYALALTHDGYSLAAASAYAVGIFEIAP